MNVQCFHQSILLYSNYIHDGEWLVWSHCKSGLWLAMDCHYCQDIIQADQKAHWYQSRIILIIILSIDSCSRFSSQFLYTEETDIYILVIQLWYPCHLVYFCFFPILTSIGNSIVEIRRSYDRLISTMGFPILARCHLYIASGPWSYKEHVVPLSIKLYIKWYPRPLRLGDSGFS